MEMKSRIIDTDQENHFEILCEQRMADHYADFDSRLNASRLRQDQDLNIQDQDQDQDS